MLQGRVTAPFGSFVTIEKFCHDRISTILCRDRVSCVATESKDTHMSRPRRTQQACSRGGMHARQSLLALCCDTVFLCRDRVPRHAG